VLICECKETTAADKAVISSATLLLARLDAMLMVFLASQLLSRCDNEVSIVYTTLAARPLARKGLDMFALARAIHILSLIHWIGGVAVVTTIVLPHARALPDAKQALEAFDSFERQFAAQARITILLG
jgi:hypothetical protein